jgi:hypothetical protein
MASTRGRTAPEVPRRTPDKGPKAAFPTAAGGDGVRVTPGAGGHDLGTPTACESKRGASNVRTSY